MKAKWKEPFRLLPLVTAQLSKSVQIKGNPSLQRLARFIRKSVRACPISGNNASQTTELFRRFLAGSISIDPVLWPQNGTPKKNSKKDILRPRRKTKAEWWEWYKFYLTSDKWYAFRSAVIAERGPLCQDCGMYDLAIHLHHLTYERVGNERREDVKLLCPSCHETAHGRKFSSNWPVQQNAPKISISVVIPPPIKPPAITRLHGSDDPIRKPGQPCRHCGTPVVKKVHSKVPRKEKKGGRIAEYYFEWWLKCPNRKCRAMYMQEEAKRFFQPAPEWFASLPSE